MTRDELTRLGELVVNSAAVMVHLGHVSPAQSTVYMESDGTMPGDFLRDYLLTCLVPTDLHARGRIAAYLDTAGDLDRIAEAVTR